jgi:hypothetical protein
MLFAATAALFILIAATPKADAYTAVNFGFNGGNPGADCYCFSLQDGLTPQSPYTPSFLAISNCPGNGMIHSYTQPETQNAIGIFYPGNVVSSLPAPAAGYRRVLVCGNPPGSTPLFDYGQGVLASYADVPCPNGVSLAMPVGPLPPWFSQFQSLSPGGGGGYPVCNP